MKFTTTLLALAMAAIAPNAFAQSADLSITGRIFPGACTVELGNGGVADLGSIRAETLNAAEETALDPVTLPMTVACESEVRYAFTGTDNAGDSSPYTGRYGLGLTPTDEKIGSATIKVMDVTADTEVGNGTSSSDNGETWSSANPSGLNSILPSHLLGFAKTQGVTTGPDPIKSLQSTLEVRAYIEPTDSLTIGGDVPINGSVTIDLLYL